MTRFGFTNVSSSARSEIRLSISGDKASETFTHAKAPEPVAIARPARSLLLYEIWMLLFSLLTQEKHQKKQIGFTIFRKSFEHFVSVLRPLA